MSCFLVPWTNPSLVPFVCKQSFVAFSAKGQAALGGGGEGTSGGQEGVPQSLHAVKAQCQSEAWTIQSEGLKALSIIV